MKLWIFLGTRYFVLLYATLDVRQAQEASVHLIFPALTHLLSTFLKTWDTTESF